jgi:hypothetical protein
MINRRHPLFSRLVFLLHHYVSGNLLTGSNLSANSAEFGDQTYNYSAAQLEKSIDSTILADNVSYGVCGDPSSIGDEITLTITPVSTISINTFIVVTSNGNYRYNTYAG